MEAKYSKELISRMQDYMKRKSNANFSIEEAEGFLDSLARLALVVWKVSKNKLNGN